MLHQLPAQHAPFAVHGHGRRESSSLSQPMSPTVQLPRKLSRPQFTEVSHAAIIAAAPELANVPVEYIRRGLRMKDSEMLAGLSSLAPSHASSSLSRSHLPASLSIPLRAPSSQVLPSYPTHALAVSSSKSSHDSQAIVMPIHSLVLASHCALVPELRSAPLHPHTHTLNLPVIHISLPSPAAFSILRTFMYTHSLSHVLKNLFPFPSGFLQSASHDNVRAALGSGQAVHQLAMYLCESAGWNLQTLTTHAAHVKDLWQDMVALGLYDPELWDAVDLAWEVVLGALNLAARR